MTTSPVAPKYIKKIIQWAKDNSCGEATPDDYREKPSETDKDDNEDEDEVNNNNNNNREKTEAKKRLPCQKWTSTYSQMRKKFPCGGEQCGHHSTNNKKR